MKRKKTPRWLLLVIVEDQGSDNERGFGTAHVSAVLPELGANQLAAYRKVRKICRRGWDKVCTRLPAFSIPERPRF